MGSGETNNKRHLRIAAKNVTQAANQCVDAINELGSIVSDDAVLKKVKNEVVDAHALLASAEAKLAGLV